MFSGSTLKTLRRCSSALSCSPYFTYTSVSVSSLPRLSFGAPADGDGGAGGGGDGTNAAFCCVRTLCAPEGELEPPNAIGCATRCGCPIGCVDTGCARDGGAAATGAAGLRACTSGSFGSRPSTCRQIDSASSRRPL